MFKSNVRVGWVTPVFFIITFNFKNCLVDGIPGRIFYSRGLVNYNFEIPYSTIPWAAGIQPPGPRFLHQPQAFKTNFIQPLDKVQFPPFHSPAPGNPQPYRPYTTTTYWGYNKGQSQSWAWGSKANHPNPLPNRYYHQSEHLSSGYGQPSPTKAGPYPPSSYGQRRPSQSVYFNPPTTPLYHQHTRAYQQMLQGRVPSHYQQFVKSTYDHPPRLPSYSYRQPQQNHPPSHSFGLLKSSRPYYPVNFYQPKPTHLPSRNYYGQPKPTKAPSRSYGQPQSTHHPSNPYGQPEPTYPPRISPHGQFQFFRNAYGDRSTQVPTISHGQSQQTQSLRKQNGPPPQFFRNYYRQSQPTQRPINVYGPRPTQPAPPLTHTTKSPQFPSNFYVPQFQSTLPPMNSFRQSSPPQTPPQRRPSTLESMQKNELEMYKRLVSNLLKRLGEGDTLQNELPSSRTVPQRADGRRPKLLPGPISPLTFQRLS